MGWMIKGRVRVKDVLEERKEGAGVKVSLDTVGCK